MKTCGDPLPCPQVAGLIEMDSRVRGNDIMRPLAMQEAKSRRSGDC